MSREVATTAAVVGAGSGAAAGTRLGAVAGGGGGYEQVGVTNSAWSYQCLPDFLMCIVNL